MIFASFGINKKNWNFHFSDPNYHMPSLYVVLFFFFLPGISDGKHAYWYGGLRHPCLSPYVSITLLLPLFNSLICYHVILLIADITCQQLNFTVDLLANEF